MPPCFGKLLLLLTYLDKKKNIIAIIIGGHIKFVLLIKCRGKNKQKK